MDTILNILTIGLRPLYYKHYSFYLIIINFRNKLPRKQNQAQKLNKNIEKIILKDNYNLFSVIDLSTQKVNFTESDVDLFYNQLNHFDYNFVIFKNYYKSIVKNLNRFNPKANDQSFDTAMLIDILKDQKSKPYKPFPILWYHIKYKYKLTSWIFRHFK